MMRATCSRILDDLRTALGAEVVSFGPGLDRGLTNHASASHDSSVRDITVRQVRRRIAMNVIRPAVLRDANGLPSRSSNVVRVVTSQIVYVWLDRPCRRGCLTEVCPLLARVQHTSRGAWVTYPRGVSPDPPECGSWTTSTTTPTIPTRVPDPLLF